MERSYCRKLRTGQFVAIGLLIGWVSVASGAATVELVQADGTGLTLDVRTPNLELATIELAGRPFTLASLPEESWAGAYGEPMVPVLRELFVAPAGATFAVDVDVRATRTLSLADLGFAASLAPRQMPVDLDPTVAAPGFAFDEAAYGANALLPAERVKIKEAGVVRGHQLYALEIYPVAYDGAAHLLRHDTDLHVNVRFEGGTTPSHELALPFGVATTVLNPPAGALHVGRDGGNMLVVHAHDFDGAAALADYIQAKRDQGFNVSTYDVPAGMTNHQIKSYIQGLWGTPMAPDYVLLVGDTNTIPHWTGGGTKTAPTDLTYACMDGSSDWYPDIHIGRFSVRTIGQLQAVVDKVLTVERGTYPDPHYADRAAFICTGDTSSGGEETQDYIIDEIMEPNGYSCTRVYATMGHDTAEIFDAINAGQTIGVYYGHSASSYWFDPTFDQDDVRALSNEGLYPTMFSYSCNAGKFSNTECLAETWLIEADKGAAAAIMTSTYIYYTTPPWHETSNLEIFFFESHVLDGIREVRVAWDAALMKLVDYYGPEDVMCRNYFEMFNLLGDPSMKIPSPAGFALTATPAAASVCAPPTNEVEFAVEIEQIGEFADTIDLSATNAPDGATVSFSPASGVPPFSSVMTVSNLDIAVPGLYTMLVTGTAPDTERLTAVELYVSNDVPTTPTLVDPPDNAADIVVRPAFDWDPADQAVTYTLEVATEPTFSDPLLFSATTDETTYTHEDALPGGTNIYWRVRADNGCGEGADSSVFNFLTLDMLSPVSYDLQNGESGIYNYYDDLYDGDGNNNEELAWLTNGLGDLTDGVRATSNWNSEPAPYVGWASIDPEITFHFDAPVRVRMVIIHLDDSAGTGGVFPPPEATFVMGGESVTLEVQDPPGSAPFDMVFPDLSLMGDTLEITVADHNSGRWIMISEVEIFGGPMLGDLNCDGVINNFDIDPFVLSLTDPAGYAAQYPDCNITLADINGDGAVNNFDIDPFVALLTGM